MGTAARHAAFLDPGCLNGSVQKMRFDMRATRLRFTARESLGWESISNRARTPEAMVEIMVSSFTKV